jgi:hypothetical protein
MNPILLNSNLLPVLGLSTVVLTLAYNSVREPPRITRSAILYPCVSPWRRLLDHGHEKSFITLTGFNREGFEELHGLLTSNAQLENRTGLLRPRMSLESSFSKLDLFRRNLEALYLLTFAVLS